MSEKISDAQIRAKKRYRDKTNPILICFNLSDLYLLKWADEQANGQGITTQTFIRRLLKEAYDREKKG